MDERRRNIATAHEELKRAKRIVIVGGGTVGVELAAEIVGKWGEGKQVKLITSHERCVVVLSTSAWVLLFHVLLIVFWYLTENNEKGRHPRSKVGERR